MVYIIMLLNKLPLRVKKQQLCFETWSVLNDGVERVHEKKILTGVTAKGWIMFLNFVKNVNHDQLINLIICNYKIKSSKFIHFTNLE